MSRSSLPNLMVPQDLTAKFRKGSGQENTFDHITKTEPAPHRVWETVGQTARPLQPREQSVRGRERERGTGQIPRWGDPGDASGQYVRGLLESPFKNEIEGENMCSTSRELRALAGYWMLF